MSANSTWLPSGRCDRKAPATFSRLSRTLLAWGLVFVSGALGVEAAFGQGPEFAGIFGSRNLVVPNANNGGIPYTMVLHADNPAAYDAITYSAGQGWGFEIQYPDPNNRPYGDRGTVDGAPGKFGPFDDSPNNRGRFSDSIPDQLYDSFIGQKNFLTGCQSGTPDTPVVCDPPEGGIFRIDVPNGSYRFVGVFGDADNMHAARVLVEDGGSGTPDLIGPNHVVLVNNHDQAQYNIGTTGSDPGDGVFARVGFDAFLPPVPLGDDPNEGIPVFVDMDESGMPLIDDQWMPTGAPPNSPTLNVTQGYIRLHLLQGDSNPGLGGDRDQNGGDIVLFEVYPTVVAGELIWDGLGDGVWGFLDPNSRWRDENNQITQVYPDSVAPGIDAQAIINEGAVSNLVSVNADRTAVNLTVNRPVGAQAVGVVIADGVTLSLDSSATFDAGSTLSLGTGSTLDAGGNVEIGDGSAVSLGGGSTLTALGSLDVGSGSPLAFGANGTLSSRRTMTIAAGSPVSFGSGGALAAGGGSIDSLATSADAVIDVTAGTLDVGSLTRHREHLDQTRPRDPLAGQRFRPGDDDRSGRGRDGRRLRSSTVRQCRVAATGRRRRHNQDFLCGRSESRSRSRQCAQLLFV